MVIYGKKGWLSNYDEWWDPENEGIAGDYFPDCGIYESRYARGQETGFFYKLDGESKEIFCKRGRGEKWEDADKGVGRIVYFCVLFFYDVFMDLSRIRGYLELRPESILRLLRVWYYAREFRFDGRSLQPYIFKAYDS